MESYEEFCLRSLAFLQEEGKFKKSTCEPLCSLKTQSVILFHGRAILSPLLTAEQRHMMCNYRRQAVQLEVEKQNQQRNRLLARVQDLLDKAQIQTSGEVGKAPSVTAGEYTLVTDSPGLSKDSGRGLQSNDLPAAPFSETCLIDCYKAVDEEKMRTEEKSEEEDDDEEEEDFSLDSLLKKSREYVKQEQKVLYTVCQTPSPDSGPDTNSKGCNPTRDSSIEFGFSLHHSPVGQPKIQIQHQPLCDSSLPQSGSLSPGFLNQQICHPDTDDFSDFSPATSANKKRQRPVSTGNIHISFPIEPADLIPRSPGRSGESVADWEGSAKSSHHRGSLGNEYRDSVNRGVDCGSINWSTSPVEEICSPASNSGSSPSGHFDCVSTQFRRRCHTLDNHQQTGHSAAKHIDRSQERIPRFMAGVTWLGPNRRLPADSINQSYNIENPPLSMLRPCVTPDSSQIRLRMEPNEPQCLNNSKLTLNARRNRVEAQTSKSEKEGAQRQAQALEDMQRHLEDEHAMQMSQLLAEQDRAQQRLVLEHEQAERKLKGLVSRRPLSADASGWNHKLVSDNCPIISPTCPRLSPAHTPSERTPGHSIGFPSPVSSNVSSPSIQSPIYMWGPIWTGSKPQARLSQVMTSEQQRAFCRISAITRGFLTRSLLKIEKVKHLRQTILDTQEFIRSLQTEVPQKRVTSSTQDLSLQERVRAQLRAALYDIHDIFFQMPLPQRLALLQQDRELRLERKLRDMEKPKSPKEKVVLSAATQRSLDRKKRASGSPAQNRKIQLKPKSPTTNRVLKPSQGQNSPASGPLNRQGSWYRKTPEERVRRSDSLKKQHSLG